MLPYAKIKKAELTRMYHELRAEYENAVNAGVKLDMSRGKPGPAQLDLAGKMLDCLPHSDYMTENGIDCRNYGGLDGIPEMKRIFAELLDVTPEEVIIGGNSSLTMMFDNVASNMTHGVRDGIPWQKQGEVKFLCPVPGYDRHFAICEYFHIKMIPVPMTPGGPDMDTVERLVGSDHLIKGMWCVPVFSNPSGCVYSAETVRRIAAMKPKAHDFRLYWDNAYFAHNFEGERPVIPNIQRECAKAGSPHMPLEFASFSKISLSGAAVSCIASSASNCQFIHKRLTIQTIGPDKLNQLRHVRFFKDARGVYAHMEKIAEIIKPKFDLTDAILTRELKAPGIASWAKPSGGYFVSVDLPEGCARRTVKLCAEAGLIVTGAGATFPHGHDPRDSNIRVAPTYPDLDELEKALELFCTAAKLAALEKLIGEKME